MSAGERANILHFFNRSGESETDGGPSSTAIRVVVSIDEEGRPPKKLRASRGVFREENVAFELGSGLESRRCEGGPRRKLKVSGGKRAVDEVTLILCPRDEIYHREVEVSEIPSATRCISDEEGAPLVITASMNIRHSEAEPRRAARV